MADVLGKNNYDKMPQIDGVDIVPSGGTAGQALIKDTGTDYDYSWGDVSATLEGLTDTTITTPTNGEYLKYNGSAWVNATIATTLDGLTDTNITSVAAGELLKWDGANWINNTLAEAGVAAASHNHDSTYIDVTGDTMTGFLTLNADPTANLHAATKQYVDAQLTVPSDLPTVQARRTTTYTLTTSYADITFDATDEETDAAVVKHDDTNTDQIDILSTGTYLITYNFSIDCAATNATTHVYGRVRKNDTTVLNGSDARTTAVSDTSIDGTGGNEVDDHLSNSFVATLTSGDFISFQLQYSGNAAQTYANGTFTVTKLQGAKGDTGATGSGTNINVEDDDVAVTGTPHSTLNFGDGLTATNDGGGQVTIAAAASNILQVVQDSIGKGSTSSTLSQTSTPTISTGTEIASLSITPASTSNKIQLSWTFIVDESSDAAYFVLLFRGSTLIRAATASGFKRGFIASADGTFLDSPATTSATTYSIRVCCSAGTAYWGQNKNGNDLNGSAATGAGLTAMELSIG